MERATNVPNFSLSPWTQVSKDRWVRTDNAVVLYDHGSVGVTSKPWLKRPRGWKAFGPGEASYNFLHYFRWSNRKRGKVKVSRKWRSAQAAMKTVDAEFPIGKSGAATLDETASQAFALSA